MKELKLVNLHTHTYTHTHTHIHTHAHTHTCTHIHTYTHIHTHTHTCTHTHTHLFIHKQTQEMLDVSGVTRRAQLYVCTSHASRSVQCVCSTTHYMAFSVRPLLWALPPKHPLRSRRKTTKNLTTECEKAPREISHHACRSHKLPRRPPPLFPLYPLHMGAGLTALSSA